jgi:squalene-hopene/tetraprenyl-beta-curcumene cyclase
MGPEGLFYYLQTFSKANSVLGAEIIKTDDGKEHQWRTELIKQILSQQKGNGSWTNDKSGRWMESIPELVTAYALLALESAMGPELNN